MFRICLLAALGLTSLSACASSAPPDAPAADPAGDPADVAPAAISGLRADRDPVAMAGLCEPSGAVLGPDGLIWVVDDDQEDRIFSWAPGTGLARSHDARGGASDSPFKDPEALDIDDAGRLWVVGSHSRSNGGKVGRRAAISRMAWTPEGWKAEASSARLRPGEGAADLKPLVDAIAAACPDCALNELVAGNDDGYAFNIEGAVLHGENELLMGIRAPLVERRAVLFTIKRDALFGAQPVSALLTGAWAVDLGGRGVRDLARSPDGNVLILAGPAPDGPGNGFALYRWRPGDAASPLGEVPRERILGAAEAVVPDGNSSAWVLFDEGDRLKSVALAGGPHHRMKKGKADFACGENPPPAGSEDWAHALHVSW